MDVFPIGHYVGERHPEGTHLVRVGLAHLTMTPDEFGVWVLAHHDGPTWTVDDLRAVAGNAGLSAAALDRLVDAGALAVVADQRSFAGRYRLEPLLVGLGNTREHPETYAVGLPGLPPVAMVDEDSYELWQWAALAPSLWHTCETRAKVSDDAVRAEELVGGVLAGIRPLLANSCAYLDRARA